MTITKEEAIRILSRYDNEHYTPATRQAHRMGAEAMNRVEELEKELQMAFGQLQSHGCDYCKFEELSADDYPCMECVNAGGISSKWKWKNPEILIADFKE